MSTHEPRLRTTLPSTALSAREAEVWRLVLEGHDTPAIAARLGIAVSTVGVFRGRIYGKLGITCQADLVRKAYAAGKAEGRG